MLIFVMFNPVNFNSSHGRKEIELCVFNGKKIEG